MCLVTDDVLALAVVDGGCTIVVFVCKANFNVENRDRVCVFVGVCVVCVCMCVCPPQAIPRKLLESPSSSLVRHENTPRPDYIDLDLHSRPHISKS